MGGNASEEFNFVQRILFSKVYSHKKCLHLVAELDLNQNIWTIYLHFRHMIIFFIFFNEQFSGKQISS